MTKKPIFDINFLQNGIFFYKNDLELKFNFNSS